MRGIRNECRTFMTRNTDRISIFEQLRWWYSKRDPSTTYLLLFFCTDGKETSAEGYGIVTREGWLTGALRARSRGRGLGRRLFEYMTELVLARGGIPQLEVRRSNQKAMKLYESLGYQWTETIGVIDKMIYTSSRTRLRTPL